MEKQAGKRSKACEKLAAKKSRAAKAYQEMLEEQARMGENVRRQLAQLDHAAEDDAELNRQSKPAINKLKMVPLLLKVQHKVVNNSTQQQNTFLDGGVLTVLRKWLEPLPDGSLPCLDVRNAVLEFLDKLPTALLEQEDGKEQLKKSGVARVVMFLSRSVEESKENRRLANQIVDRWSRSILGKSMWYEPKRTNPNLEAPLNSKKRLRDINEENEEQARKSMRVSVPEPVSMTFEFKPQSKVAWPTEKKKVLTARDRIDKRLNTRRRIAKPWTLSAQGRELIQQI